MCVLLPCSNIRSSSFFIMETKSHRLSAPSYQDPTNCPCHMSSMHSYHPLSKSSSNLLCSGQYGSDASQTSKQELRKSLSSIVCQTRAPENFVPCLRDSLRSPVHNETVDNSCGNQMRGGQFPGGNMVLAAKAVNHFLTVDRATTSWDGKDLRIHIRSSTAENVSASFGEGEPMIDKTQSADPLEATEMLVQKSHSEYLYGCNDSSPGIHHRTSATYSDFCPTNGLYETSARDLSFQNYTYELTHSQNVPNRIELITSARDQNASPVSFASDAIQHNITVYTSPGTFHHSTVRKQEPRNTYQDNRVSNSQSTGCLICGTACNNNSCTVHFSPVATTHDSCSMHCHIRNETCMKVNDTVAAYCHSLPIPAIQLAPRLASAYVNPSGREQLASGYRLPIPVSDMVTFPKLACSISESGLDAKRLMTCGSAPGEQVPLLCKERAGTSSLEQNQIGLPVSTSITGFNVEIGAKTRDTWTMTAMDNLTMVLKPLHEYKDAEVQTIAALETKSAATSPSPFGGGHSHVFPEVSLKLDFPDSPTPVHEVRWDDEGMTWEVYGASVDPEVLGLAIQKHLEIQIEEHLNPPGSPHKNMGVHSSKEEKRRSFRTIMYSLRRSSCCARSSAAVE
ncbi:G protein-regulated inducer of neurite outgrowth 2 [Ambystoma mexicanum]|uniref:G protein-regulated inducer of neurite outgrowth 2 n=1 Tax=Ambystoma mexicanum TaxID=8296 RepID=UPI0037E8C727